jgi:flavin reductase (DIM6/NTAB) family NADH-FMN oxidoreductase RutF
MLFDFASLSGLETYKLLAASVVPRPIAWVVTESADGALNAAPYSFFNVLSGDPPLVAIGVGSRSATTLKDTGENIRATGQFVINLVSYDLSEAMNITAIDFPPGQDEISEAGLHTTASVKVRPPRISESPVALECEHFSTMDVGPDRAIIFGRVLAMHIADEAVMNPARCYIDTAKLDLIGRMGGASGYARTRDAFEVKRIDVADWVRTAAE